MNCNFTPFPILQTKRLCLRQMTQNDSKAIFAYHSNKENYPYVDMTIYKEITQASNYIHKVNDGIAQNRWVFWSICMKESDDMIGRIAVWNLNHEMDTAEIGYSLFPEHRGNGYMTEGLSAVCTYVFDVMELRTLEASTNKQNAPSIRLLENSGFTCIKAVTKQVTTDHAPVKMNFYILNRPE